MDIRTFRMAAPAIALLVVIVTTQPLKAASDESVADAFKTFGLIGSWSPDCANDKSFRITFAVSTLGSVTLNQIVPTYQGIAIYSIDSAVRVTDDKIKITFFIVKTISHGQSTEQDGRNDKIQTVYIKTGNKIRVQDSQLVRTGVTRVRNATKSTGEPTEIMEKCLN